ncbi:hypothetical protein ERJ75_001407400 [Trypanosoma vivax]|nr:hypothetical protein ERJ75_001407300 [Trypanosoma vivax]KAH8607486.1 hypothetical protein ERJ75_001407400 [Trypanosoma vivax]
MSEDHAPLFIVSLRPAKSSAVQHERALLSLMASGTAPPQMFPSGLQRAAAASSTRKARPMMRWELGLVCNAMWSERGYVAMRLAWVTAGRCDEIALLQKENFVERPSDRNALIVDWGLCQKHSGQTRREQRATWRSRARMSPWWEGLLQKWLGSGPGHLARERWKKSYSLTPRRRVR